jgi:hypothetical protein
MTKKIRTQWSRISPVGQSAVVSLLVLLGAYTAFAVDTDNDGMSDVYELFFGLNPADPSDGIPDYDQDALNNMQESGLNTDPFTGDTDRDQWTDGADSNPVSRAYFDWGNAFFTLTNVYAYAAPGWMLGAEMLGGEWTTNPPTCWHVPASETNPASLLIDIVGMLLTNDAVMKLSIYDHAGAALHVDLYDTNDVMIATNIAGNLSPGTDAPATVLVNLPVAIRPDIATISIRRESGEVTIYETIIYVDQDGDGLDLDQEVQLGTSDHDADSDGDGLSDYAEVFIHKTNPAVADCDGDGLSDYAEIHNFLTDPNHSDSDQDGLSDGSEVNTYGTDPRNADSDGDQMGDGWEVQYGLDPLSGGADAGFWTLDESSGAIARDSTVNANDGVISGAGHVPGLVGNALRFDGSNGTVSVRNSSAYKPEALTVSCLAKFNALFGNAVSGAAGDGRMVLVAQANAGDGYGYALYKTENNALVFEVANSGETNVAHVESMAPFVATGIWFSVIGTYDGTNACLYVDGQLIASKAHSSPLEYDNSTGLVMGNNPSGRDSSCFDGVLDSIRILPRAMTAAEIAEPYGDLDGDGKSNLQEARAGSDPTFNETDTVTDSDHDGLSDYAEVNIYGTDRHDSDTDNDGIPDGWEVAHGLVPVVNDAAQDPDQDGLTNLQEYQRGTNPYNADTDGDGLTDSAEVNVWQTNPLSADTDGDLLPDKWEVDNGTNPRVIDATADPDGDNVTNLQEYTAGTNPKVADTDGDGMDDGWEMYAHTDPLVADGSGWGTLLNSITINPVDTNAVIGRWEAVDGNSLKALDYRGSVGYSFDVSTQAVYVLEVSGVQMVTNARWPKLRVLALMDDERLGNQEISALVRNGKVYFITPLLTNGTHSLWIDWDNVYADSQLKITGIGLLNYSGSDNNTNGTPDWVDNRLSSTCTWDPIRSLKVSPVCIEGNGLFMGKMKLAGTDAVLKHGAGNRWYADVPLAVTNATEVQLSVEDGERVITRSLAWEQTDILGSTDLMIRKGDALLLTAAPTGALSGSVTIDIPGITNCVTTVDAPVMTQFSSNGIYTVTGSFNDGATNLSRSISVKVVAASFPTNLSAVLLNKTRDVINPGIPTTNVVIQGDAATALGQPVASGTGIRYTASLTEVDSEHYLVARLGNDGPILDSTRLLGTWVREAATGFQHVDTLSDGSMVWQTTIRTGYFPVDGQIKVSLFAAGAMFEDGSHLLTMTAGNLDELGGTTYRVVVPPGCHICHHVYMVQNGATMVIK